MTGWITQGSNMGRLVGPRWAMRVNVATVGNNLTGMGHVKHGLPKAGVVDEAHGQASGSLFTL